MSTIQNALKSHVFGRIGNGQSLSRDVPFFYHEIDCTNPAHKISIINQGLPERPDWYYRIYQGGRLVCTNRHFISAEDALSAAYDWSDHTGRRLLRQRPVNPWGDMKAFTIDGLRSADVTILEFSPGVWRIQSIEDGMYCPWSELSWFTVEEAFAAYPTSPKVN